MEEKKILEVIAKISGKNIKDIELKDNLRVLGINSLETVELFLELEETFGITFDISELDIDTFDCVEAIINLTKQYIDRKNDNERFLD